MDEPPPVKRSANATIQLDRLELDEILLADVSEPVVPSALPPPLPPEEIARAASLAPGGAPPPASSRRMIVIGVAFVALLAFAIAGGVAVGGALRPAPATSTMVAPSAAAPADTNAAPTTTITIHTMELGGKTNGDE